MSQRECVVLVRRPHRAPIENLHNLNIARARALSLGDIARPDLCLRRLPLRMHGRAAEASCAADVFKLAAWRRKSLRCVRVVVCGRRVAQIYDN